jgi:hypothetical protein
MPSFMEKEVEATLTNMKVVTQHQAPDDLRVIFFKWFWSLTKPYILAILNGYALGRVDVARL